MSQITSVSEKAFDTGRKGALPPHDSVSVEPEGAAITDSFKGSSYPGEEPLGKARHFLSSMRDETRQADEQKGRDRRTVVNVVGSSSVGGPGTVAAFNCSGLNTYIHENAHLAAGQLLYELKGPEDWYLQFDSGDLFNKLCEEPTVTNLKNYVLMYDINQDGSRGGMYVNTDHPSELGNRFTSDQRFAIGSAAGPLSTELPLFATYALGHAIRKSHPALGYTLMIGSLLNHTVNSVYPASALFLTDNLGNDFTSISSHLNVHPAAAFVLFAAALPAFAAGLAIMDSRNEARMERHIALSRLITRGEIGEDQINESMKAYEGKSRILELEDKITAMQNGSGESDRKAVAREMKKLQGEYGKFSDYLAGRFESQVEPERERIKSENPKGLRESLNKVTEDLKWSFKNDPLGSTLTGVITGGTFGIIIKQVIEGLKTVTGVSNAPGLLNAINTTSGVLGKAVPIVCVANTAASTLQTVRTLRDEKATGTDKALAAAGTACTAVTAAGVFLPGLGIPLTLVGIVGSLAVMGIKAYIASQAA
ncbi:MAG: hypothetical protein AB9903_23210 [Vulcanimicrobiota bacterium]